MITCFCDPYPGEILYSVWARYSDRVQYHYKTAVLQDLFGSTLVRPILDFPCHLKYFVDNLPPEHGYTVDYFIDHHTLLPFYGAFFPPERLKGIRNQMILGDTTSLHWRMGLSRGEKGISSPHWLRYCPVCVEEDRMQFGECYWHCLHQVPNVELCPLHKTFLEKSSILARGLENGRGLASAEQTIKPTLPRPASTSPFFEVYMNIAIEASYLLEHPFLFPEPHLFSQRYHALFAQYGFMTQTGKIRVRDLLKAFIEHYSEELLDALHCKLKQSGRSGLTWLARLTYNNTRSYNPLYHILVTHFLNTTLEKFYLQDLKPPSPFGDGPWPCLNPVCEYYRQRRISTYQINEAYKKGKVTGIFTCTCGYAYVRSGPDLVPNDIYRKGTVHSYGPIWEAKLSELWSNSEVSLKDLSRYLGVDPMTARNRAAKLNLPARQSSAASAAARKTSQIDKKKDRIWYRAQWLAILEEAPDEALKILQRRAKGIYSWLVRNDREWFAAHHPIPGKRSRSQVHIDSAREDQRIKENVHHDTFLAESIRKVAYNLMNLSGRPVKVTRRRITIEIPEVRRLRARIYKFPLATQALQEVMETREAFALRRIQWIRDRYLEERVYPQPWQFLDRAGLKMQILQIQIVKQAFDEAMNVLSRFA
jgi:Tn7-like transposition protein D/TniQ protein